MNEKYFDPGPHLRFQERPLTPVEKEDLRQQYGCVRPDLMSIVKFESLSQESIAGASNPLWIGPLEAFEIDSAP